MSRETLENILVPGGAFLMLHEFTNEGRKRRFFFILNREPQRDSVLLLVTATSNICGRLRHRGEGPVVIVSPGEYPPLPLRSAIDCASAEERRRSELFAWATRPDFAVLDPLPRAVLCRLRQAVAVAKTLTPTQKELVLGPQA